MASKFIKRVGTKKEMHLILMKVVSLEIPVKEPKKNVKIQWKRGDLRLETAQPIELTPESPCVNVLYTFKKLSAFYRGQKSKKYQTKYANLYVKAVDETTEGGTPSPASKGKTLGEL